MRKPAPKGPKPAPRTQSSASRGPRKPAAPTVGRKPVGPRGTATARPAARPAASASTARPKAAPASRRPRTAETGGQERLQKILAAAGIASRRACEAIILDGRVQVNGKTVSELGAKADPRRDQITVDLMPIHREAPVYILMNKPKGYVTTVKDDQGRPTVMALLKDVPGRLYPVGRLDFNSEGLLLMTNDGALANQLTRAASQVPKVYLVKISGRPAEENLDQIRSGIMIDRGRPGEGRVMTAPVKLRLVRDAENPWFELTLIEGRNREIRKMFEEIGHHVEKIRRVGYGPLVLDLEPGQVRELTASEVDQLRLATQRGKKPATAPGPSSRPRPAAPAKPRRPAASSATPRRRRP